MMEDGFVVTAPSARKARGLSGRDPWINVFFDGGVYRRSGVQTFGWLIKSEQKVVSSGGGTIVGGAAGSFFAEIYALREALNGGVSRCLLDDAMASMSSIRLFGDNRLLMEMLADGRHPKDRESYEIFADVLRQIGGIREKCSVDITWVPREQNRAADRICRAMAEIVS